MLPVFSMPAANIVISTQVTVTANKKADVEEHIKCLSTSAYLLTSPSARPGCSSSSHPTDSLAKLRSNAMQLYDNDNSTTPINKSNATAPFPPTQSGGHYSDLQFSDENVMRDM